MPTALDSLASLPEADRSRLMAALQPRRLAVGDALVVAGEPVAVLGVVDEGVLRELYPLADGTERTKWFALEGDFTGSLPDALAGTASVCAVVAETPAVVRVAPASFVLQWMDATNAVRAWSLALLQRLYVRKAERERELVALDAWGRYQAFRDRFPGLEARISQRVVATYVGVTPEHLSRLRARRGR